MGLQYDNSAVYYFVIAVFPFYLLPATYSAIKHVWARIGGRTSRTAKLRKQLDEAKLRSTSPRTVINGGRRSPV